MAVIEIARIQVRRGQESVTGVPQLAPGEMGWAEDTEHLYIGKRIIEGAKDDNNTRLLTENDLVNVFAMIAPGSTVASTSSYQYREFGVMNGVTTATFANVNALYAGNRRPSISMALKLDQSVSLVDFSDIWPPANNNITLLTNAVLKDLYANSTSTYMPRTLKIPAGNYYVNDALNLPPNTTLIGEGKDITIINLTNDSVNLMQTVDTQGNKFASMTNNQGINPVNIRIEHMTLAFNTGTKSISSLLSLDNVRNAMVKSVKFIGSTYTGFSTVLTGVSTATESTANLFVAGTGSYPGLLGLSPNETYVITGNSKYSTTTVQVTSFSYANGYFRAITTSSAGGVNMDFGSSTTEIYSIYRFIGGGKGVSIRTLDQGSLYANSNNIPYSENTQILDCDFSNLYTGVVGTSSIFKSVISNNTFRNSFRGIHLYTDSIVDTTNGPLNVQISRNIFDTIYKQAIVVGSNPNGLSSNVISSNNYYTQVGNGLEQPTKGINDNSIAQASYPIIDYISQGNLSSDDYFNRAFVANSTSTSYYNVLVKGTANIQDQASKSITIPNSRLTRVVSFPITNDEQFIEIKYQMTNSFLSRKGTVSLNVRANINSVGAISVSDNYVYTEDQSVYDAATNAMTSEPNSSYDYLLISPTNPTVINTLYDISLKNINGGNSTLYVTGSNQFADLAAFVIAFTALTPSTFEIITQSSSPQFNYDPLVYPLEKWSLLTADTPVFVASTNKYLNYVTLMADTTGAVNTGSNITYNITYQTNIFQR